MCYPAACCLTQRYQVWLQVSVFVTEVNSARCLKKKLKTVRSKPKKKKPIPDSCIGKKKKTDIIIVLVISNSIWSVLSLKKKKNRKFSQEVVILKKKKFYIDYAYWSSEIPVHLPALPRSQHPLGLIFPLVSPLDTV